MKKGKIEAIHFYNGEKLHKIMMLEPVENTDILIELDDKVYEEMIEDMEELVSAEVKKKEPSVALLIEIVLGELENRGIMV